MHGESLKILCIPGRSHIFYKFFLVMVVQEVGNLRQPKDI